jgi:hypothetical protein
MKKVCSLPKIVKSEDRWGCWTGEYEVSGGFPFFVADDFYERAMAFSHFEPTGKSFDEIKQSVEDIFEKTKFTNLIVQFNAVLNLNDNDFLIRQVFRYMDKTSFADYNVFIGIKGKILEFTGSLMNGYSRYFGESKKYERWIAERLAKEICHK